MRPFLRVPVQTQAPVCSMLADAKVYRGSNSCRVRITSSLNGHTYVAKYFGDGAVLRREHDIRRTAAAAALPPVRHMDIKRHRHVVQSAVSITPDLQALDSFLQSGAACFTTRSSQVRQPPHQHRPRPSLLLTWQVAGASQVHARCNLLVCVPCALDGTATDMNVRHHVPVPAACMAPGRVR